MKYIYICGRKTKIEYKKQGYSSWNEATNTITIDKFLTKEEQFLALIHEIMEAIFSIRNMRYSLETQEPDNGDYLFSFNHKEFNLAMEDFANTIKQLKGVSQ